MKKIFTSISILICASFYSQNPDGCNQLFITEILSNNVTTTNGLKNNYVIEVYNPLTTPVNLSGYSLRLTKISGVVSNIALTGTVQPASTWQICHSNAELCVKNLSACNTSVLDFSLYKSVELKHGMITLDAFGEKSTSTTTYFNYLSFINDPVGYVATNKIGLNSLQSMTIRRSMKTVKGDSAFTSLKTLGRWSVAIGSDITHLGVYKGVCNKSPKDLPIIGYNSAFEILDEDPSLSNIVDNLDISVDIPGTYYIQQYFTTASTAVANTDICFYNCSNPANDFWNSSSGGGANYARTTGSLFSGQRKAYVQMAPLNGDFVPDPASQLHIIYINGNSTAGIKENYLSKINVAPSIPSDNIFITNSDVNGTFKITDVDGKVVLFGEFQNNTTISVSNLSVGMYFLTLKDNKVSSTRKFIKQ